MLFTKPNTVTTSFKEYFTKEFVEWTKAYDEEYFKDKEFKVDIDAKVCETNKEINYTYISVIDNGVKCSIRFEFTSDDVHIANITELRLNDNISHFLLLKEKANNLEEVANIANEELNSGLLEIHISELSEVFYHFVEYKDKLNEYLISTGEYVFSDEINTVINSADRNHIVQLEESGVTDISTYLSIVDFSKIKG